MLLTATKQNMHTIKKLNETIPACVCMSIHNTCIVTRVRAFNLYIYHMNYCPLQQLLSYILYYRDIIQNAFYRNYIIQYILYLTITITIILYVQTFTY